MPQHVLVISHDIVGSRMSGPGIRYSQLARVLAATFDVTLAVPGSISGPEPGAHVGGQAPRPAFRQVGYERLSDGALAGEIQRATVIVAPAWIVAELEPLLPSDVALVVDVYDPYVAEVLAAQGVAPHGMLDSLLHAALRGDLFMCANRRQRFWWLGWLEACGRLNEWTYRDDPLFARLVALVPFGLPELPAQRTRPIIKGVWPEVAATDRVILWGGGIWPWLDAHTAIRAMTRVSRERPDLRLVFPGTQHPNPAMAGVNVFAEEARRLADDLGLTGQSVVFGDWVPYADWQDVLLDSDIGLTLHHPLFEAELANRGRALDYMWAELPIVATEGDAISELVTEHRLGCVVRHGDADQVADALLALAEHPKDYWQANFRALKEEFTWPKAAAALVAFCQAPSRSADAAHAADRPGFAHYRQQLAQTRQAISTLDATLDHTAGRLAVTEQALAAAEEALAAARSLISDYESGRFIRFIRWLHRARFQRGDSPR